MTESSWDKAKIQAAFAGCATLKEIIARLESEFVSRGEVICEITVNGVLLNEGDETRLGEMKAAEIDALAVRSNLPSNLINDAIRSAQVLIRDLEKSCLTTAERFRGSDIQAAQRAFHECLEGCQWLVDTLMHVRGAASGTSRPLSHPERWYEAEKLIARVIRELSEAYSDKDHVLVADLLEYEMTGALAVWQDAIDLESRARGGNEAAAGGETFNRETAGHKTDD
jgi:hypothetical protein